MLFNAIHSSAFSILITIIGFGCRQVLWYIYTILNRLLARFPLGSNW